jgi:hypothetical protein
MWRVWPRCRHDSTEDAGELRLPIREGLLDLPAKKESMRELACDAEGDLVFDIVCDEGGVGAGLIDTTDVVAVVPVGEWAADLAIAEVLIPRELADLSFPAKSEGSVWEGQEAEGEPAAGSSRGRGRAQGARRSRLRGLRRNYKGRRVDASLLPLGHQQGKIFRVGEEIENSLDRIWKPLLGVIGKSHAFLMIRCIFKIIGKASTRGRLAAALGRTFD